MSIVYTPADSGFRLGVCVGGWGVGGGVGRERGRARVGGGAGAGRGKRDGVGG